MDTIYTKFTDYRRARFRLMTSICEDRGKKVVIKKNAPGGDALAHLEQIAQNRLILEELYQGKVSVCPCSWEGGSLVFPFLQGTSYLELLRDEAAQNGLSGLLDGLAVYTDLLEGPPANRIPFTYTDAFQLVFGRIPGLEGLDALAISNLDASPGNLIRVAGGTLSLIDYEWVFDFPIPRDFIVYRHLRFLYSEQGFSCLAELTLGDLLEACGVRMEQAALSAMYDGFQQYVCVEDNASLSCAEIFERHRKPIIEGGEGQYRRPPHFVFFDKGEGFNEQEKLVFPAADGDVDLSVDVIGVRSIRFDPFEGQRTLADQLTFTADGGEVLPFETVAGPPAGPRTVLNVPANVTVMVPEGAQSLKISGAVRLMNERDDYWLGQTQAAEAQTGALQQALEGERQQWAAERDSLNAQTAALRQEQDQLLQTREAELEAARQQLAQAAQTHEERERESSERIAAAEQEAAQLRETITALYNSKSWRATAWLRKLRAALRRSQ